MANEDKKNAALRRIDEAPVRARQAWQHNATGGKYDVIAVGIDEPTLEPVVIYVGHDGIVWTRALDVFLEEKDGQPRFSQIVETSTGVRASPSYRRTGIDYHYEVSK